MSTLAPSVADEALGYGLLLAAAGLAALVVAALALALGHAHGRRRARAAQSPFGPVRSGAVPGQAGPAVYRRPDPAVRYSSVRPPDDRVGRHLDDWDADELAGIRRMVAEMERRDRRDGRR